MVEKEPNIPPITVLIPRCNMASFLSMDIQELPQYSFNNTSIRVTNSSQLEKIATQILYKRSFVCTNSAYMLIYEKNNYFFLKQK